MNHFIYGQNQCVVMFRKTSECSLQRSDSRMANELEYELVLSGTSAILIKRVA